jgi:thiosulfate/3-mercaptopyruvate sulfurtransferase
MKKLYIALLISLIDPAALAHTAAAAISDYFVDTSWLSARLDDVTVVDVRVGPKYLLGHIEGAHHIDKKEFLSFRRGVKSLIPTVKEAQNLFDRYGITPGTTVVVYAEHNNPYSARFAWTLKYHGHEKVYVLDGGYEKWSREGLPTSLLPTRAKPVEGYRITSSRDIRAEADQVLTRLSNTSTVIWDTRRPSEYEGTEIRADRGGHIPGAVHLHWTDLLEERDGIKILKSRDDIEGLLTSYGITRDKTVIAHCQTGIRSAYATLVLLALDYRDARNYDGSWIEWANNQEFPVGDTREAAVKNRVEGVILR